MDGMRKTEEATVWAGFHRAWSLCVGTPGYDKGAWLAVESQLCAAIGLTRGEVQHAFAREIAERLAAD